MFKKSMIAVLGTMAVLLASQAGYANAPTFDSVPDVVIGDADFNAGLTFDANFFTYINALNVLDYLKDADSANSALRVAFKESPADEASDLEINDKLQLLAASGQFSNDPSTWGTKELTGGGTNFFLSFRDLIRSPQPGGAPTNPSEAFPDPLLAGGSTAGNLDLLPWHNTPGSPSVLSGDRRAVQLFGADEDNVVSQSLFVYSINNGVDGLSGGYTTLFDSGFGTGETTDWQYENAAPGLAAATSSGQVPAGYLGLASGINAGTGSGSMYFGRWRTRNAGPTGFEAFQAMIPATTADMIYHARYRLLAKTISAGHPSGKTLLSDIRLGFQNATSNLIEDFFISSSGQSNATNGDVDLQMPDVDGAARDYNIQWASMASLPNWQNLLVDVGGGVTVDARTFQAYFDLVDKDSGTYADEGAWRLDDYAVVSRPRPANLPVGAPAAERFVISDLTTGARSAAGGGFELEVSGGSTFVTALWNQPTAGKMTFQDRGVDTTVTPNAAAFKAYRRFNTAVWEAGKTIRATAQLSCPTTTDRNNFHISRFRHNIGLGNIIHVMAIRQANMSAQGNPGAPATTATDYEAYLPSFGGPGGVLLTNPALVDLRNWLLCMDQVAVTGWTTSTSPTNVVWHQVLYEVMDELPTLQ